MEETRTHLPRLLVVTTPHHRSGGGGGWPLLLAGWWPDDVESKLLAEEYTAVDQQTVKMMWSSHQILISESHFFKIEYHENS